APASAAVAAAFAAPACPSLVGRDGCDYECGERVGPPPACEGVGAEAEEECDREVGAELCLRRLLDRGGGMQLVSDAPLGVGEEGHRRGGEGEQAEAEPHA